MNYNELDRSIRRGIKTIVEYWDNLENGIDSDEDEDMDAGILYLIEDTFYNDRSDIACGFDNLSNRFFTRFGYSFKKARILNEKLVALRFVEELDHDYIIKLLKEFDLVSCCLSDMDTYPIELTESLYAISLLEKHDDLTPELQKAIWYIMSFYRGCPSHLIYKSIIKEYEYDYEENDLPSPEDREETKELLFDGFVSAEEDDELDPEIYGCCVKVRFPNNKTYKYNCRFDDVEEGFIVSVTGKMSKFEGTVVEKMEMWDTSDYMEEVDSLISDGCDD
jgi:hypothetical protein